MARAPHISSALLAGALCTLAAAPARATATMVIDNADPAGQGLNDPTPFVPVGGNAATTLGAARLAVFQQAASVWGAQLTSSVVIHVDTQFTPLTCTASSAVLASTGTTTVHRDFAGAPLAGTWYPQALANALAHADLDPTNADIATAFNSALGGSSCLAGTTFYLGFDGHPGAGQIDMLTTVLHELAHGLGFQTFEDLPTGTELNGFSDAFLHSLQEVNVTPTGLADMTNAQRVSANESDPNLYWSGANVQAAASSLTAGLAAGHVRLYAPPTIVGGSSVSHYSTALTPNELMEPVYTGPNHNVTLTAKLLQDLGWPTTVSVLTAVPAVPASGACLLAGAMVAVAARRLRRGPSRCVR